MAAGVGGTDMTDTPDSDGAEGLNSLFLPNDPGGTALVLLRMLPIGSVSAEASSAPGSDAVAVAAAAVAFGESLQSPEAQRDLNLDALIG